MGALEHAYYRVKCPQCGKNGTASWWESNNWTHVSRLFWGLKVSIGFARPPGREFCGLGSFYGRPLRCESCAVDAEITEIDSTQFYSIARPAEMVAIAGTDFKSLNRRDR